MITLRDLTAKKTKELLEKKEISCLHLAKEFFDRIEEKDRDFNAYLYLRKNEALEEAGEIDKKIAKGENPGKLAGLMMAIKDNMLVKNSPCTAGSKILQNYIATYDATIIKKLKEAGTIILGKTNMDEFAMGSSNETSAFNPVKNPLDETKVPGGSSGGSAAAVAGHEAMAALGSDTGGSIRQPASFCGLVGFKPTYGAVSRFGLIAMASSLDQIGPLTKTVEDAGLIFETIKGKDRHDATCRDSEFSMEKAEKMGAKNLKAGIIKECFDSNINSDLKKAVEKGIKDLESLGVKIEEISVPHIKDSLACYYTIMPAEVSSNLARFDGLRYSGSKPKEGENLKSIYQKWRGEQFGKEVRRRIILGTFVLSSGYYDAFYAKARKIQHLIKNEFLQAFEKCDFLISPTTPDVAFNLGEKTNDPVAMYLSDIFTVPANIAGLPAISLPVFGENNLPFGFQLIGRPFGENEIFAAALDLEKINQSKK